MEIIALIAAVLALIVASSLFVAPVRWPSAWTGQPARC